jgi:transposase InsO family protein
MLASFSGVGCGYDTAPMASFGATLNTELVSRHHSHTLAEAQTAIFAYLEGWYNRPRRPSTLGYLCPEQFEHQFQA